MDEIPLVWRKAGDPPPANAVDYSRYRHDTDLFYGAIDNDFLLGWIRRHFQRGFVATVSWRVCGDEHVQEIGDTRTLAEAKELLIGYIHIWWITAEADAMKTYLKERLETHEKRQRKLLEVSRQYFAARQA